ncbi:DUF1489 domain-containing protein [Rhodospirillaceae bacterium SYSU D60014]|uniref:DUF1489 family protein n=1 Tax=Virgifigura deserti TaxID=2268457 RepID=UPI000E674B46
MTVHLVKLCVGTDSIESLRQWQEERLADLRRQGKQPLLRHCTRSMPKRREEVLAGGSLYWVIKGWVRVRQPIVGLEASLDEEGRSCCAIQYDTTLVPTIPRAWRPFQGWRYLECADAPPDLDGGAESAWGAGDQDPPVEMLAELRSLGLL